MAFVSGARQFRAPTVDGGHSFEDQTSKFTNSEEERFSW
jgi:hypothetical protein